MDDLEGSEGSTANGTRYLTTVSSDYLVTQVAPVTMDGCY
jgi:hypothetical protein